MILKLALVISPMLVLIFASFYFLRLSAPTLMIDGSTMYRPTRRELDWVLRQIVRLQATKQPTASALYAELARAIQSGYISASQFALVYRLYGFGLAQCRKRLAKYEHAKNVNKVREMHSWISFLKRAQYRAGDVYVRLCESSSKYV